ncbi:hypothetical protein DA075_02740 [Methylobacterium currus]|uniref:Uncharacterized protein n=1 Tax=Methylobacterium currus TaxID=2051553 RepID=A0A2R4WEK9_9HYPH|nr:hypothetical protein [Methylobacterium currus]AWB19983.1 hypothetical protein DA075_02740 [Methylobacterium currus]UHC15291.1 hypothetical protein LRS73_22635 [Methylobacterium currus]
MPASEALARRYLALTALILALLVTGVAGRVIWFDAYWIFRDDPPWRAVTDGNSRLLDRQTRRAKVLQALTRPYDLALIGSSTVYHGLDPADVTGVPPGRVFNAGISAVIATELPVIAAVVASRAPARATLGLDYYMFSRPSVPVHLDEALATLSGRLAALMGSVLGRYALADSRLAAVAGGDDPGSWTRAGFRITPPLAAVLTLENDATRRRTTAAFRPETLAGLDLALDRLSGVDLAVYLSPVSDAQRRVLADLGLTDDFSQWREAVMRLCAARGRPVLDLTNLGDPYPFDPAAGSTPAWLDNLHYTPLIGRQVLERLGLRRPAAR